MRMTRTVQVWSPRNADPSYPRLAINIVIAFYLNQGAVRGYFEWRRDQDSELAQGGR